MLEIKICGYIIDYYKDKIYNAKLESLNLINLQMRQLHKNIVDEKVFQEIITLDKSIIYYESKIKEYQYRRNKFIQFKETNQAKNLRKTLDDYSRVQQDILKEIGFKTDIDSDVSIFKQPVFKINTSNTKNITAFRFTTSYKKD